ncbi:MAG: tyrosine-type recombinase/integrase [Solirubrobacteraceae bacterium]
MSVRLHRGGWEVRWRDQTRRLRAKRFTSEEAARAFDEALRDTRPSERAAGMSRGAKGSVYSYETAGGTRWRYVVRRSDGKQTSKRGFTSQRTAQDAYRRVVEQIDRGEILHTDQTFGSWWDTWLRRRKPYLEPNAWRAYDVDGRTRLLPTFKDTRLDKLDIEQVRGWMEQEAEAVQAGEVAPKTVNNALGTLVVCLNVAVKDRVIATNPAIGVDRLPRAHIERHYLRLQEIPAYLDACLDVYRPLAEVLVHAGLRISEAIALQVGDLELEETGGVIVVYRSQKKVHGPGATNGSTKGDRFRSVEIGPHLSHVLKDQVARREEMGSGDQPDAPVFVMPVRRRKAERGRWAGRGDPAPLDRNTVSGEWHKLALQDAGLRDMPLHSLRHTAAAAWLAGGNSLMYVQRQLGHADIATTERHYGHLERHVLAAGAIATEEAISRASGASNS